MLLDVFNKMSRNVTIDTLKAQLSVWWDRLSPRDRGVLRAYADGAGLGWLSYTLVALSPCLPMALPSAVCPWLILLS